MKAKIRVLAVIMAAAITASAFAGCKKQESPAGNTSADASGAPVDITWYQVNRAGSVADSMDAVKAFQEIAKKANVNLKFQHPPAGSNSNEQINLLIASKALPDIIFWNWKSMPGGISKYIKDEIVLPLNNLKTPNYSAALDKYPDCKKYATLEDGNLPAFYQLDPDPRRTTYSGFVVRKDWLEKLSLKVPETIDDWHTVLTAIKTKDPNGNGKNDELPYIEEKNNTLKTFTAAFGVLAGLCYDPNTKKVVYGPAQPKYKDFLKTMHQWYSEGLIDPDFATMDAKQFSAKIQNEQAGTWSASINKGVGDNITAVRTTNQSFSCVGIAPPKENASSKITYSPQNDSLMKIGEGAIITTACKNPQVAANLLDYCYSEEGENLLNWGVENESYQVVNGKKTFTDTVMKPSDGTPANRAILKWAMPATGNPKVMDFDAAAQIQYTYQESFDSITNWMKGDTSLMIQPNTQYTADESSEIASTLNECQTYHDEMVLKFILGTEPIDEKFDGFVQEFKKMNIDQAIKATQDAVDRMNKK